MEEEKTKRKNIVTIAIGVFVMLVLVVGSTYAFFQITGTTEDNTNTNFKGELESLTAYGTPHLSGTLSDLYITLNASDMALSKAPITYWATNVKDSNYEEDRIDYTMSTASVSGRTVENGTLECTSDLTITATLVETEEGTEVSENPFVKEDGYVYLSATSETSGNKGKINPNTIDLKTIVDAKEYKTKISYTIVGNTSVDIKAAINIINRNANQNALAGKRLTFDIKNENLSCSVKPVSAPGTKLEGQANLTSELVNGIYRYQGNSIVEKLVLDDYGDIESAKVTDTVDNNYICLGNNCSEETQYADMYRIIGITQDNIIKVVKLKSIGDYAWTNYNSTPTYWNESIIYNKLNIDGESFLSVLNSNLQEKIIKYQWKYVEDLMAGIDSERLEEINNQFRESNGDESKIQEAYKEMVQLYLDTISSIDAKSTGQVEAKIGLMSASDYCNSFENGSDINCVTSLIGYSMKDPNGFGMSWLSPMNNDSEISYEWTMNYSGVIGESSGTAITSWSILSTGSIDAKPWEFSFSVRPSFYLASDIELEGEGTKTNPYKLKDVDIYGPGE